MSTTDEILNEIFDSIRERKDRFVSKIEEYEKRIKLSHQHIDEASKAINELVELEAGLRLQFQPKSTGIQLGDTVEVLNAGGILSPRVFGIVQRSIGTKKWEVRAEGCRYYRAEEHLKKFEPAEKPFRIGEVVLYNRDSPFNKGTIIALGEYRFSRDDDMERAAQLSGANLTYPTWFRLSSLQRIEKEGN